VDQINALIREAVEAAMRETDGEPEPGLTGDFEWPVSGEMHRGLDGAIACATAIGYVNGTKGWLIYRGYNCFDLAERSNFEETSYLLLFGRLPSKRELEEFNRKLISYRAIPGEVVEALRRLPMADSHPMAALRTAVSILGMLDGNAEQTAMEDETEVSLKLVAQMATCAAAVARLRKGQEPVEPDPTLSHAGNFLYMVMGQKPDPLVERIMDISLILHADHGMNASTFASMVINSSLSDMYSSIVGGLASLKGPLHGGANEQVLYDLEEIGGAKNVKKWFAEARSAKRRVMGFGHRVYKAYDPRARVLRPLADMMTKGDSKYRQMYETAAELERIVCAELGRQKNIFPNVDFYSGLVYRAMGIETAMFTPIFAVSRISGWCARVLEYLEENRIFRPRAIYTGPVKTEYVPIEDR